MRWLIVDDHPLMRDAIVAVVRDLDAQAECTVAGTLAQALAEVGRRCPEAAVVDLHLPDGEGAPLVQALRTAAAELPVLVLTASEEPEDVRRLLEAGASGYCPKSAGQPTLTAALRMVMAGETYVPPFVLSAVSVRSAPTRDLDGQTVPADLDDGEAVAAAGPGGLSARQREVLALVCEGLPNKEIARRLGLAERTVKVHVGAIFRALGVVNRTQAAVAARAAGLLGRG